MKVRLIVLSTLSLIACSDVPTVPAGGAFYHLTLVNGTTLPTSFAGTLWTTGDLLLRGDKTFRLGLNNSTGSVIDGTYTQDKHSLELKASGTTRQGEYFGSRAAYYVSSLFGEIQYVFDAVTPVAAATIDGKFALSDVQGAVKMPDGSFVLDTTDPSGRVVHRWLFDTVTFSEGLFARRRVATNDSTFNPVTATSTNVTEYGGFTAASGAVTFSSYLIGRTPVTLTLGSPGFTRADSNRTFTYSVVP
jgi:hypothetical protein